MRNAVLFGSLTLIFLCIACISKRVTPVENKSPISTAVSFSVIASPTPVPNHTLTPIPPLTLTGTPTPTSSATPTHTPSPNPTATYFFSLFQTPLPTPMLAPWSEETTDLLPAPLYFLFNQLDTQQVEGQQIWRVETDGNTLTQITDSSYGVGDYDVSPTTGQLAYMSNNQLFISSSLGANIQRVNTEEISPTHASYVVIDNLAWSPDGKKLAFGGQDGIWLYTPKDKTLRQLYPNPSNVYALLPLTAHAWSPDNTILLAFMLYKNSDAMNIVFISIDKNDLIIANGLPACADYTWALDGRSVYASRNVSAQLCYSPLGLSQWDLYSNTGIRLIPPEGIIDGETGYFVHTAQEGTDGYLYYFYGSKKILPDELQYGDLTMYRSAKDGITHRTLLRNDIYSEVMEILWSPDMSFAIIVDGSATEDFRTGALTLLTTDNKPPLVLAPEGRKLRWGMNK